MWWIDFKKQYASVDIKKNQKASLMNRQEGIGCCHENVFRAYWVFLIPRHWLVYVQPAETKVGTMHQCEHFSVLTLEQTERALSLT